MRILHNISLHGGKLYLQSDIFYSILNIGAPDGIWSNRPIQYVRIYNKGPLIYRGGYVKVYNETDRPENIHRFFNIKNWDHTYKSSVIEHVKKDLADGSYILLNLDEYYIDNTYFFGRTHYYRNFLFYGCDDEKQEFYAASHNKNTRYSPFILPYKLLDKIYSIKNNTKEIPNRALQRGQTIRIKEGYEKDEAFYYDKTRWKNDVQRHLQDQAIDGYDDEAVFTDLYGMSRYNAIFHALDQLEYNLEKTDYRIFIMIKNHFYNYISVLQGQNDLPDSAEIISKLTEACRILDNLCLCMMKLFHDTNRNEILRFIRHKLMEIINIEKEATSIWE